LHTFEFGEPLRLDKNLKGVRVCAMNIKICNGIMRRRSFVETAILWRNSIAISVKVLHSDEHYGRYITIFNPIQEFNVQFLTRMVMSGTLL